MLNNILSNTTLKRIFQNKWLYIIPVAGYLFFISFPGYYRPLDTGLDNSWHYAINYLANSDFKLGLNVFFTYGPLGYLQYPLNIGANLVHGLIFRFGLYLMLAFLVIYHALKSRNTPSLIIFLVALSIVNVLLTDIANSYSILLICGLMLCTYFCYMNRLTMFLLLPAVGLLTAIALFLKLDLGIAAVSMVGAGLLLHLWKYRESIYNYVFLCLASCAAFVLILAAIYIGTLGNMLNWLILGLDIIGGYGSSMSVVGPISMLILGLAVIACFALLVLFNKGWRTSILIPAVIFCIPVAVSFKHGFCRQDVHCTLFFLFSLAVISIFILFSTDKRQLWLASIIFAVVLSISLPVMLIYNDYDLTKSIMNRFSGIQGLKGVVSTINAGSGYTPDDNYSGQEPVQEKGSSPDVAVLKGVLASVGQNPFVRSLANDISGISAFNRIKSLISMEETRQHIDNAGRSNLEKDRLPADWCSLINSGKGTVDAIHWEIAYCPANDLKWVPNPVLQTYSAYTATLDQLCADHFDGPEAPEFILFNYRDIDKRHPLVSTPACWQKILDNYRLAKEDIVNQRFLLQKKDVPDQHAATRVIREEQVRFGGWIDVPGSDNLVLAYINMRLTLPGTLMSALLKVPPVYIDVIYDTGETGSYRIIAGNACNGLIANMLPADAGDFSQFIQGALDKKVVRMKLWGPGTAYYSDRMHITWKEVTP